jgi:hypothetical protein
MTDVCNGGNAGRPRPGRSSPEGGANPRTVAGPPAKGGTRNTARRGGVRLGRSRMLGGRVSAHPRRRRGRALHYRGSDHRARLVASHRDRGGRCDVASRQDDFGQRQAEGLRPKSARASTDVRLARAHHPRRRGPGLRSLHRGPAPTRAGASVPLDDVRRARGSRTASQQTSRQSRCRRELQGG